MDGSAHSSAVKTEVASYLDSRIRAGSVIKNDLERKLRTIASEEACDR